MKHLYDFQIGGERFAEPDDFDDNPVRSVSATLAAAVRDHKSFGYTYDFGDDWQHHVVVQEVLARNEYNYPVCIGGENACPPEDCGATPGYEELKRKLSDPQHPEHEEILQWLRGYFDPFSFDPNRINRDMLWMIDWNAGPNDQGLYLPF